MRFARITKLDILILSGGPIVFAALAAFSNSPEKVFLSIGAMFWGLYFSYTFLFGTKNDKCENNWNNSIWMHVSILFLLGATGQLGVEYSRYLLGVGFQLTNVLTTAIIASLTSLFFRFIVALSRGLRKR
jgi:hypothetical protein